MWFLLVAFLGLAAAQTIGQAQAALGDRIPFNARVQYGFPQQVWEFMENNKWGDFHLAFHMSRKYYVIGQQGRRWLDGNNISPAPFQEGDPSNGIEFLAMHRAMLEYLRQRFGNLPVNGDPEGRRTVSECLDGWKTDDEAIRGLTRFNADVERFRAGLANINNFGQFKSEDEFGLFIQSGMRLVGQVDRNNPQNRRYTNDNRPGSGVHNWMHGQLMDDNSPITVGDPRTNLPNIMFWRIHGWIENKWKQWEAHRPRTEAERTLYQNFIDQFRSHMIAMGGGQPRPPPPPPTTSRTTTTTTRTPTRRPRRTGWFLQGLRSDLRSAEHRVTADAGNLVQVAERFEFRDRVFRAVERIRRNIHAIHRSRAPWSLILHLRERRRWFRNHFYQCHALAEGTVTDNCPEGRNSPDMPDPKLGETDEHHN